MTENFKVGDLVICIDAGASGDYLTNGDGYVVKELFYDAALKRGMVVVDGIKSSFYSSRFKKAEKEKEVEMENFKVGDKVVCIRAEGGTICLVNGKVYEVKKAYISKDRPMVDLAYPGSMYNYADRFKKVEEEEKEMTYDFIETKKTIKPDSTLYRLLKITNGVTLKNHVRLSFEDKYSNNMALNSSEIEELINRLKAVKEILDSNN